MTLVFDQDLMYVPKTRFPIDFSPTAIHHQLAKGLHLDLDAEMENFKEYCLSEGKTYLDWEMAFNRWLRRSHKYVRRKSAKKPLSAQFKPNEQNVAFAESLGMDVVKEFNKFCCHYFSTGKTSMDWDAEFYLWVLRSQEYSKR